MFSSSSVLSSSRVCVVKIGFVFQKRVSDLLLESVNRYYRVLIQGSGVGRYLLLAGGPGDLRLTSKFLFAQRHGSWNSAAC